MQYGLDEVRWPYLSQENFSKESPESRAYNCIAWVCGLTDVCLWPDNIDSFWPADLPQDDTVATFIAFFESQGYQLCDSPESEEGFEKIAIYTRGEEPTHAARQLESGRWISKMGNDFIDIEHDSVVTVEGPGYGQAAVFLKKPRQ